MMNKVFIVLVILVLGLAYWTYKGVQMFQAYQVAIDELVDRPEIKESIGPYEIKYDWWFGVFRALRYGEVQEFEFHLNGQLDNAVSAINLKKNMGWEITCINVVN